MPAAPLSSDERAVIVTRIFCPARGAASPGPISALTPAAPAEDQTGGEPPVEAHERLLDIERLRRDARRRRRVADLAANADRHGHTVVAGRQRQIDGEADQDGGEYADCTEQDADLASLADVQPRPRPGRRRFAPSRIAP